MLNPNYTLEKRIQAETVSFSGEFGVYANDLQGNVIDVRADEPFETASCIKAFILADLYRQVAEDKKNLSDRLTYTAENQIDGSGILQSLEVGTELSVKNLATLMIIVSDNIATNILIDYLGLSHINETICGLGLTRTELFNKIDFERYDRLGTTTPREYGSLFERICERKLISPGASGEMLKIFQKQHYNNMLVREFPQDYLDSENSDDGARIQTASKSSCIEPKLWWPGQCYLRCEDMVLITETGAESLTKFDRSIFELE